MKKHQGRREILFLSAKHFLRTSVHLFRGLPWLVVRAKGIEVEGLLLGLQL